MNGVPPEPIAIVGIGCRFPGGADNPTKFWKLLTEGTDAIVDVPRDRWNPERFYNSDPTKPGKMYIRQGGFLREPVDEFDPGFFGIAPREAMHMDPQQRLLLEVAWEALEDAGIVPKRLAGSDTGVYIGAFTLDSLVLQLSPLNRENIASHHIATAATMTMLANRISYVFDFRGPSINVDTACSSSLVAFHYACQGLWNGECSVALAGGVNVMLIPDFAMVMCKGHFLAADGHCKSFDERADGYARGEGSGMVVLKPLSAALRDGDDIYALVRATGVNQDGRTEGITVPSAWSQEMLIRSVYAKAHIDARQVRYVEAHGTGTPVGDPIEAAVLAKTVGADRNGSDPCVIGSVKANIGHLEAAAGVAGVIKASLCLKHGQIPPQCNLKTPNSKIPWADWGLRLPAVLEPMPEGEGPAYAGINSFGYGGTNAHAVLQDTSNVPAQSETAEDMEDRPYLLPISARNKESLMALARSYASWLSSPDAPRPGNLCFSASLRRSHLEHRLAVTGRTIPEIVQQLTALVDGGRAEQVAVGMWITGKEPKPVFVFTGMGPQWWAMGHELLRNEPVFRKAAEACDEIFQRIAGWSILAEMTVDETASCMEETRIAQPANFVLQVALAALWRSWGVEPAAIMGHSVGEVAAAHVAGALDLEDSVRVIYHRSRLQQTTAGAGKMLAVSMSPDAARTLLEGRDHQICIAAVNSPTSVTLSGDPDALEELARTLEQQNIFNRFLRVTVAYHSHQMEKLQAELETCLKEIRPQAARIPLYSTVTGRVMEADLCDARYWYRNIRECVLLADALDCLIGNGYTTFLELGPHPVLSASISECLMRHEVRGEVLASLRRKEPEAANLMKSLGRLYVAGYPVDWPNLYPGSYRHTRLPSYAWQKERCWMESERNFLDRTGAVVHPLLGMRAWGAATIWECDLNSQSLAYLRDHIIDGVPLLPAAAYVEGGLAIRHLTDGDEPAVIEDLELHRALSLDTSKEVRLQWSFDEKTREYRVSSLPLGDGAHWTHHASARLSPARPSPSQRLDLEAVRLRCTDHIDAAGLYTRFHARGFHYGPSFQSVQELYRGPKEVLARLDWTSGQGGEETPYHLPPSLLDGSFQSLIACLDAGEAGAAKTVFVPVRIRRVRYHRKPETTCWCVGSLTTVSDRIIEGDLRLCTAEGEVIAEVEGLRCAALQSGKIDAAQQLQPWAYTLTWTPAPAAVVSGQPSRWLVFMDHSGVGVSVAAHLYALGATEVVNVEAGPAFARQSATRYQVRPHDLGDIQEMLLQAEVGACRGVVYLWGLDLSGASDPVGEAGAVQALRLVQALTQTGSSPARLYLVTRGAQQVDPEESLRGLAQASLVGLARVAASEHPELRCTLVDIDPTNETDPGGHLCAEILADSPEDDVALRGSERYVHRFARASTSELEAVAASSRIRSAASGTGFTLEAGKTGSLDSLRYREIERRKPAAREIQVRIQRASLNFKDVLKVLGVLPEEAYQNTFYGTSLGMEAAAIVTAVGEDVHEFNVGDAIVGAFRGSFSSHTYASVDSLLAEKQLDHLNPADWASVPIVFMTAYYALCDVARLSPGEKVLIHAATGGVGLAAIQVARWVGAEIIATAGSPAKRDYLRSLGIEHIFDSRSVDFADGILSITNGRGVDVVLNSLSGEALLKSVSVMAPFGRFVEIGKRDIVENTRLPMLPFNRNLSFSSVDLDQMLAERFDLAVGIMKKVWERFRAGDFHPLPVKVFPAGQVSEAFRYVAQSKQVGKVIIDMENLAGVSILPSAESEKPVKPDGTYLITGGFGGIGLEVGKWLADQGARHLVLVGRRGAASPLAKQTVEALKNKGVSVMAAAADISQEAQVANLMAEIASTMPPLRGVFHAAAVLDDGLLANLDKARFEKVMAPKALGAWFLHQHTRSLPLDCFVLFSSVSAWVGNPGQANYAAANAFLDALALRRRAEGLAATSISWGAVADVGMLANDPQVADRMARSGIHPLPVASVVGALASVLRWNPIQLGLMEIDWGRWSQIQPITRSSPRFSHLMAELDSRGEGLDSRNIQTALAALPPEKRVERLSAGITELVAEALHIPSDKVNVYQPFTEMGIDSLMGVELQTAIEIKLGIAVSVLELMKSVGIIALAEELLKKMKISAEGTSETAGLAQPELVTTAAQ